MNFHGNFFFDVIPFIFGVIGLIFYVGLFALIILGIVFLYKKIQGETRIDKIEKDLKEIKYILENMKKESKGDSDEK